MVERGLGKGEDYFYEKHFPKFRKLISHSFQKLFQK
jgi:hypothetical protein